jgi:hypothetical protein
MGNSIKQLNEHYYKNHRNINIGGNISSSNAVSASVPCLFRQRNDRFAQSQPFHFVMFLKGSRNRAVSYWVRDRAAFRGTPAMKTKLSKTGNDYE